MRPFQGAISYAFCNEICLCRYDSDGNLICDLSQIGSLAEEESIISLAADDYDNIYIAGYTAEERLFVQNYSLLTSTSRPYSDELDSRTLFSSVG